MKKQSAAAIGASLIGLVDAFSALGQLPSPSVGAESVTTQDGYTITEYGDAISIQRPRNLLDGPDLSMATAEGLRSEGFVFIDRNTQESVRKKGEGRVELRVKNTDGTFRIAEMQLGSQNDPTLTYSIGRDDSHKLTYIYDVQNRGGQRIKIISLLSVMREAAPEINSTEGWVGMFADHRQRVSWLPLGTEFLAPGSKISGLTMKSSFLPGLTEARFSGMPDERPDLGSLSSELQSALSGVIEDDGESRRITIGPVIQPPGVDRESRLGVVAALRADLEKAAAEGWATPEAEKALNAIFSGAEEGIESKATLKNLSKRAEGLPGVDPRYRGSVAIVLESLGAD